MPSQVFVHIGLPKTGTTYLQDLMYANRAAFARQDVTVVGTHALHYQAASELAGVRPARAETMPAGAWDRVVAQVRAARTPRVVLSSERYSLCRRAGVRRVVEAFADVELHVVVTVRDLVAAEPSAWQEYVKNGGTLSWPDFCAQAVERPGWLRAHHRVRRVLTLWPELVPPERIHAVTVPPPDRPGELMLERFSSVVGVDPDLLATTGPRRRNTSLDYVTVEMLRRLNAKQPGLSVAAQRAEVKQWLANGVLSRRGATSKPVLSGPALSLVAGENEWMVERLASGGFDVVGDLADLRGSLPTGESTHDTDPEALLDAALEALVLVTNRSHRRGRRLHRIRRGGPRGVARSVPVSALRRVARRAGRVLRRRR